MKGVTIRAARFDRYYCQMNLGPNRSKGLILTQFSEFSKKAWDDINREVYEGVHLDYSEIALQFAFLMLFGVSFPIVAALAWASNFVELWIDSFKLCWVLRRPMRGVLLAFPKCGWKFFKASSFSGSYKWKNCRFSSFFIDEVFDFQWFSWRPVWVYEPLDCILSH